MAGMPGLGRLRKGGPGSCDPCSQSLRHYPSTPPSPQPSGGVGLLHGDLLSLLNQGTWVGVNTGGSLLPPTVSGKWDLPEVLRSCP